MGLFVISLRNIDRRTKCNLTKSNHAPDRVHGEKCYNTCGQSDISVRVRVILEYSIIQRGRRGRSFIHLTEPGLLDPNYWNISLIEASWARPDRVIDFLHMCFPRCLKFAVAPN